MNQNLRILLVQGHRNTSGGNAAEMATTPHAARAIQRALQAAGHTADMLQNESDWFPGSLDIVAREVVRRHDRDPYDLMLDVHFEGDARGTRGVFAIVPDGDQLRSLTPHRGSDSLASNSKDVRFAGEIARAVARQTGLPLRTTGVVAPGVMSERQTGVGGQGYRLAMFGYTAAVRHRMVRLVLELGNIRADADIISSPGFFDRAAAGVVNGIANAIEPERSLATTQPAMPPFGTLTTFTRPVDVQVAVDGLNVRRWAQLNQRIMRVLYRGNSFSARGWIVGDSVEGNPIWWVMGTGAKTDLQWRVWSGGTNYSVEQILALPTKEATS